MIIIIFAPVMHNSDSQNEDMPAEAIRSRFLEAGACAVGFAKIESISKLETERYANWLKRGHNAGMSYMGNYPDLRFNPRGLLENASTLISLAFPYRQVESADCPGISSYACYPDYHKTLRKLLKPVLKELRQNLPEAEFRICIDSAPVMERYWAQRAGIGFRGDNGMLIVPGYGSFIFLAEIITNMAISPDEPCEMDCGHCGACIRNCPGKAINADGTIDCRRCISYLTIEHRGDWVTEDARNVMDTEEGKTTIFGCDLCLRVCPHNKNLNIYGNLMKPDERLMSLSVSEILDISSDEELKQKFPDSPISRAGISGLHRNALNCRQYELSKQ